MTLKNKRKHQRFESLNLSYVCLDENKEVVTLGMGRTLNISVSGILLETHFPIEPQYLVVLTIGLEEDLLDINGKPIHSRSNDDGKFEVGIEFLDPDKDSILVLKDFIKRLEERKERDSEGDD
jgi:hypothetical protein